MAKKKTQSPSGFDELLGGIYSNSMEQPEVVNMDELDVVTQPNEDDDTKDDDPADDTTEDNLNDEDDKDIPQEVLDRINNQPNDDDVEDTTEPTEEDLLEAQHVGALFDAIGQSLGWNMNDIEQDERPLTVDDLTGYFVKMIKQNSVPEYANEEIQQLDEYVKNGGNFADFYAKQQQAVSLDNIDMDDEDNQKAVVRELLRYNGYTEQQINSKIARYEDNDMLIEESEDALGRLKEIRKQELEETTRKQEQLAREQEEQSRQFFNSVSHDIENLTDIRGIAIPKEDRRALFDYIFKVDQTGMSQYQKDFNENLSKNLIESAYFTMKADAFISTAKKTGETSAAEKLRKMLRHSSKNHTKYNADDKQKSVVELASRFF